MVISIILLAAGILALALIILLTVKKKLAVSWGVSLMICSVIVGGIGGTGLGNIFETRNREYGYIYTALKYMEINETDPAALYLKRVNDNSGYHLTAAQTLLEQLRGNDTVAKLRLGVLESISDGSDEQRTGVTRLKTWQISNGDLSAVVSSLENQLPLSDKQKKQLDTAFTVETGGLPEVFDDDGISLYLRVNQAIGRGDWYSATEDAMELVRESVSARNRLLLAQVIAEAKYSGYELDSSAFLDYDDTGENDTWQEEYDELMERCDKLEDDMELVNQELHLADEEESVRLNARLDDLTEQYEETRLSAENIYLVRALSSIADIHSLEAQVVRARIYFAMGKKDESIAILRKASGSLQAALSNNHPLVNALRLVDSVYGTLGEPGVDSPEFREQIQALLGSVDPELVNLGLTPLVSDFAQAIISDQKVYGSELYIVGLDTSKFPRISVRLGGQEEAIEAVAEGKLTAIKDTYTSVDTYEITYDTGEEAFNSVCFVVDTSGSMGGQPISDAKAAVIRFLDLMEKNAELALVQFESSASTIVDLTNGIAEMKSGVNSLYGGGGTDITAGIREGAMVLEHANGNRIMILMTDGQSNIDTNAVQQAADAGITIFTVGFGGVQDDILQTIADMTGGQYIRADSSDELINVYSSLQSLIGNTVTVTYTVESTSEKQRYFYITDGGGTSARREYFIGENVLDAAPSAITVTSTPTVLTREYLDRSASYDPAATTEVYIYGTGLDIVTAAKFGGIGCQIADQGYGDLTLEVPASISNGLLDLILETGDGEVYTFPDMLAVGQEYRTRDYVYSDLAISCSDAVITGADSLVLLNPRFSEVAPKDVQTLSMETSGIIIVEGFAPPADSQSPVVIDSDAFIQICGTVYLGYGDSAYDSNVSDTVLNGMAILECTEVGSSIVPVKEVKR